MHVFRAGDKSRPKLIFLSGSGTVAPALDFKILYEKLQDQFRIIAIEKFGYGYSDLYEGPCDIDSVISFYRQALEAAGEQGPFVLLPHSMSGLEAIRWKQLYPEEIRAIIGLDMAVPASYAAWDEAEVQKRVGLMRRMRRLKRCGLLFWHRLSKDGLTLEEFREKRRLWKRNFMNPCFENEGRIVLQNVRTVAEGGSISCPVMMFVSDGKFYPGWIDAEHAFAEQADAEMICLNCGHYIHHFESERISQEIRTFMARI